jgi:hypothetical protein
MSRSSTFLKWYGHGRTWPRSTDCGSKTGIGCFVHFTELTMRLSTEATLTI